MRRLRRLALPCLVLLVAACGDDSEATTIPGAGTGGGTGGGDGGNPGPGGGSLPEDVQTTTGALTVPTTGAQTTQLAYVTVGRASASRALVLHFGGPGSSAVDTLPTFVSLLPAATQAALLDEFLLIGLDEFGVSNSEPLNCDDIESVNTSDFSESALASAAADFVGQCQLGYDFLELTGTPRYARDIERLRIELAFDTFDFLGYSYGTQVAMTYAALFPQSTGRIVLDSPVDPRDSFPDRNVAQSVALGRALQAFFDFCDAPGTECTFGNGDADGAFDRLYSRFDGAGQVESQLNIEATVVSFTIVEELWPTLGAQLSDFETLNTIPSPTSAQVGSGPFFATTCTDLPIQSINEIRAANTQIMLGEEVFQRGLYSSLFPCLSWGTMAEPIAWSTVLPTLQNVLVVGGDGDSRTPVEFADALSATLQGEIRVRGSVFSHAIGLQGLNTCFDDAILEFLVSGTVSETDCP